MSSPCKLVVAIGSTVKQMGIAPCSPSSGASRPPNQHLMSTPWWSSSSPSWDGERRGGTWQQDLPESPAGKKEKEKDRDKFKKRDFLGCCQQASPSTRGQKKLAYGSRELVEPTQDRTEQDRSCSLYRDDHPRHAFLAVSRRPPNVHPVVAGRRRSVHH